MERQQNDRRRDERALGFSVLVHLCAVPLFVALFVGAPLQLPDAIRVTTGTFQASIEHRAPRAAPSRAVAHEPAPRHRASTPVAVIVAPRRTAMTSARRTQGSPAHTPTRVAVAVQQDQPAEEATPTVVVVATPGAGTEATASRPSAAPTAAESPGPAPSAALARSVEPVAAGGWGQNFRDPTLLDDAALNDLRARYHGAVAHIDVDEEGHATKVSVEGGNVDADARAEIERALIAVRYVPAECNGLPCSASFKLTV